MTETVAIALITAVAALVASALSAGLTSWITLQNTRRQNQFQLALTHDERQEQRAKEHRTSRRDAYVRFLTEALEAGMAVRAARAPNISDDEFRTRYQLADDALIRLVNVHALVTIEGPPMLYDAAARVRSALQKELDLVVAVRDEQAAEADLFEARSTRALAVGEMATVAREALGGN